MSFVYGLMYALLSAYLVVFQGIHGMNLGVGGLPFIGLIIGELLAGGYILWTKIATSTNWPPTITSPFPNSDFHRLS